MHRVELSGMRLGGSRTPRLGRPVRQVLFGLFLLQAGLVYARLWLPTLVFGPARWPDALFVLLATAATVGWLTGQLPAQNVMLAGTVIAVVGGAAHTLGASTEVPFGPLHYTDRIGDLLFKPLPWAVPLLWLVAVLNARGVARLIMRPWRKTRNYGFWVIGLAVALVVLFDLGLEPFATQVNGYWSWQRTKLNPDWYSAPVVNFLGWALVAGMILAFVTPALINKSPAKRPPAWEPLVIWLLVNGLFACSAATHQLWPAFWLTAGGNVLVAGFALWGLSTKHQTSVTDSPRRPAAPPASPP
jgi:uncharacterized membrane protein